MLPTPDVKPRVKENLLPWLLNTSLRSKAQPLIGLTHLACATCPALSYSLCAGWLRQESAAPLLEQEVEPAPSDHMLDILLSRDSSNVTGTLVLLLSLNFFFLYVVFALR